jgi:hypothetical protein
VASPRRKSFSSNSAPISRSNASSSWAAGQNSGSAAATTSAGTTSTSARVAPPAVRVNRVNSPVAHSISPRSEPATPTGQVTGIGRSPIVCSTSSSSSRASRPGRSHLLTKVSTGIPRLRQTSNSLSVCGSRPLAASSSITAASTAASTR